MTKQFTRRDMIKVGALTAAGAAVSRSSYSMQEENPMSQQPRKRVLRIAHLTDIHVQPERNAEQWMRECLRHVHQLKDQPDVIFNGGDTIMDAFGQTADRTRIQWELWKKVMEEERSIPLVSCIGNHDVWGWNKETSGATGEEPLYGKRWAMESLGLTSRYFSFDQAGWHFVVLDSTHAHGEKHYRGRLDEEQFEWFAGDLASVDAQTPTLVLSHIPILSASAYFDGDNEKSGDWVVPGAWMHLDARRIKDLFLNHPQVKLCLSGHIHLLDRVDYNGVTYLCNGAVCGNWWKGNYQECPPGYALINLYDDGSFEHEYVLYGWKEEA